MLQQNQKDDYHNQYDSLIFFFCGVWGFWGAWWGVGKKGIFSWYLKVVV